MLGQACQHFAKKQTQYAMKVYIASENPVKIEATREGFQAVFPGQDFSCQGFSVPSGVPDQPMSDEETYRGAANRAKFLQTRYPNADYWVGIEGGTCPANPTTEAFAWIVVRNARQTGQARSASFPLPPDVVRLLDMGIELGLANDKVFSQYGSKLKGGAVGSLTNGAVSRTDLYVQPVKLALIPFIHPQLFPL